MDQIGAYRMLHRIGVGGMGEVWRAEHTTLGRHAAIKVLRPELSYREDIVARFFNEARAATAIDDPGIVKVFDVGTVDSGRAYIVMELLDGEPLDQRLKRMGVLAVDRAVQLVRQVATTLAAAHARGIIHRDLKPENIFIVRDAEVPGGERPKLLDFGIAKLTGMTGVKTQTAAMMGTPAYMSPEQCRGAGQVDERTDIYALGCVLFALVTGRAPFDADGVGEVIAMHLREPAPQLRTVAPHAPAELETIVARCLAKEPAHRYSAVELAAALAAIPATKRATTMAVTIVPPAVLRSMPTTLSSIAGEVPSTRRGQRWVVGAALAAGAIAGVIAIATHRESAEVAIADAPPPPVHVAATPQPPPPPLQEAPATPPLDTKGPIARLADAFAAWAPKHPGAPCPTIVALGVAALDAWQRPLTITCTTQPADQIIGIVSAGPDGKSLTDDDLASWEISDIAARLTGRRWTAAVRSTRAPARPSLAPRPAPTPPTVPTPPPQDNCPSGIPFCRR